MPDDSLLISWPSWFQFKEDQYVLGGEDGHNDEGELTGLGVGPSEGSGVGASVVGSNVGFLDGWSVVGRLVGGSVGGGVLREGLGVGPSEGSGVGAHVAGTGMLVGRVTGANVMAVDGATVVLFEGLYGGGTYDDVKPKKGTGD